MTPEQKAQNVKAFETVVKVAAMDGGPPIAPLMDWYSLGQVSPVGGRWYFCAPCEGCRRDSPLFGDFSEGDLGMPFRGCGVQSTCYFCTTPIRYTSERIHSMQWPLEPGQPEPESEYKNRKPRMYTEDPEYRPLSGPLHHYTSLDVVESIVRNRIMWATHVNYLNDASESKLGRKLMSEVAKQALGLALGTDAQFLEHFLRWIGGNAFEDVSVYVLCFSEAHDDLGQWRAYTKYGSGACLSLSSSQLVARMQAQGWQFQNCRYIRTSQLAWAEAILSRMRREASLKLGATEVARIARFDEVLSAAMPDLLQVAAIIKHSAFSAERETRFISPVIRAGDQRISYRDKGNLRIPYVHFDLGDAPLAVHQIMAGPGADQQSMEARVERLVREAGVAGPCILGASGIPYREFGDGQSI